MPTKTVRFNWNPKNEFTLQDDDNYQIILKKPKGVRASDLLPMALIGCASQDVISILEKQKQELHELKVTADSTQDADPPWRFRTIHVHYQFIGKGIDADKARKAIQLGEENYCAVYATLRDAIEITHDFEIVEA